MASPANTIKRPASAAGAHTTIDAKAQKDPTLVLSSQKLTKLPDGMHALKHLTCLDVSNNPLGSLPENCLPPGLVELTVTGCQLAALPSSLRSLKHLHKVFAGANRITDLEPLLHCPVLQHAGLAYNCISALPPADALVEAQALLSLDLSHNDLERLHDTLHVLTALPNLANLALAGNPMCLSERYELEARTSLRRLVYLDGNRLDGGPGRPTTTGTTAGQGGAALATARGGAHSEIFGRARSRAASLYSTAVHFSDASEAPTTLELDIAALAPAVDPFGWLKDRWQEQIEEAEAANATVAPALEVPVPPLQPVIYHFEMTDNEGTPVACIPLKLVPPVPPDLTARFDPKAKAAAAAAAAKEAKATKKPPSAKGKPGSARSGAAAKGKGGKGVEVLEPIGERTLQTGRLKLLLPIRTTVKDRDWLRSGTQVTLYRTTFTATPRPPSEEAPPPVPKTPPKGKKRQEEVPQVQYDISSATEAVGMAMLRAGARITDGCTTVAEEQLEFRPPAALFDERGVRMPLKDPRHVATVVAAAAVTFTLHANSGDGGEAEAEE